MNEQNGWPIWLKSILPAWLESTGYPAAGVGDQQDLRVKIAVGEGGRWVGFVNTGWFYHNHNEQYNYAQVGSLTVTGSAGPQAIGEAVSFRPSWGPVLVSSLTSVGTVTASGTTKSITLPLSHAGWLDTGIVLASGSVFTLSGAGSGTWGQTMAVVNANGDSGVDLQDSGTPLAAFRTAFSLVATVSPEAPAYNAPASKTYQSGVSTSTHTANQEGRLWIAFNDIQGGYVDNTGSFTVSAHVTSNPYTSTQFTVSEQPYTQHANSFQPATSLTWYNITGTDHYYALVPANGYVVGMRDLSTLSLGVVSASGAVYSDKLYYYDVTTGKIVIKPRDPDNIEVFADIIYPTPLIKMKELLTVQNGKLTTSYGAQTGLADLSFTRGYQTVAVSGIQTTNTFTNPLSGCFDGDWVVASYYICKSYVLQDHKTLVYYTHPTSGEAIKINWESSIPDVITNISLADGDNFNLNPLFPDAYRAGYLMHAMPLNDLSSYWSPGSIELNVDKSEVVADFGELIKVTALVRDENDLPLPLYPVTITATSSATALVRHPATDQTDGRGEFHALYSLSPASTAFSFQLAVGSLSKTVSALVLPASSLVNTSKIDKGFTNLVVTDVINNDNALKCYVNCTSLDGIPVAASVLLDSELASQLQTTDTATKTSVGSLVVTTAQSVQNLAAYTEFGYRPQPHDKLVALSDFAQSPIIDSE